MPELRQLKAHRIRVPLVGPFTTAVRSATELETVLVEAVDDDGRSGWGEAPASKVTRATSASLEAAVQGPLSALVTACRTVEEALGLLERSPEAPAARSAVDCALHDLAAQRGGQPLFRHLQTVSPRPAEAPVAPPERDARPGPGVPGWWGTVRTDMTLSVAQPPVLAQLAAGHVAAGFDCLKIKLSAGPDALAALRAVRAAVGPAVTLRVDANQAFGPEEAIALIRRFEEAGLDIELVEQPVAAGDWEGLARVSAAVDTPVMADESVWSPEDLELLLRHRAAPMVNIKLAKSGGLRTAQAMIHRAQAEGLQVVIGCMLESPVGIGAAASLAWALPGSRPQDLDGGLWLRSSPVRGGSSYRGPVITLAAGPGLGIGGLAAADQP